MIRARQSHPPHRPITPRSGPEGSSTGQLSISPELLVPAARWVGSRSLAPCRWRERCRVRGAQYRREPCRARYQVRVELCRGREPAAQVQRREPGVLELRPAAAERPLRDPQAEARRCPARVHPAAAEGDRHQGPAPVRPARAVRPAAEAAGLRQDRAEVDRRQQDLGAAAARLREHRVAAAAGDQAAEGRRRWAVEEGRLVERRTWPILRRRGFARGRSRGRWPKRGPRGSDVEMSWRREVDVGSRSCWSDEVDVVDR